MANKAAKGLVSYAFFLLQNACYLFVMQSWIYSVSYLISSSWWTKSRGCRLKPYMPYSLPILALCTNVFRFTAAFKLHFRKYRLFRVSESW